MKLSKFLLKPIEKFLKHYQFMWDVAYKLSDWYPLSRFFRIPRTIILETTNICNLRCPACPTNNAMYRPKGVMDLTLFKSIIDEFKGYPIKPGIAMSFSGEPTLHPQLSEFIQYAKEHGHGTYVSSNATMITKDKAKQLIESGLEKIHLCLDGFSKKSHEAYRIGSTFEQVKGNIENFCAMKRELGRENPFVTVQSLLTAYSENEQEDLINWAREIGANSINLKTLNVDFGGTNGRDNSHLIPQRKELRRKQTNLKKSLCSLPLTTAVIYWNGSLGLCCIDYNNKIKLGDIHQKGFIQAYRDAAKVRKLGFQKKYDICKNCFLSDADSFGTEIKLNEQRKTPAAAPVETPAVKSL